MVLSSRQAAPRLYGSFHLELHSLGFQWAGQRATRHMAGLSYPIPAGWKPSCDQMGHSWILINWMVRKKKLYPGGPWWLEIPVAMWWFLNSTLAGSHPITVLSLPTDPVHPAHHRHPGLMSTGEAALGSSGRVATSAEEPFLHAGRNTPIAVHSCHVTSLSDVKHQMVAAWHMRKWPMFDAREYFAAGSSTAKMCVPCELQKNTF